MIVKELIKTLQSCNKNAEVVFEVFQNKHNIEYKDVPVTLKDILQKPEIIRMRLEEE